ncbi:caspase family protein [Hwanghaeella sp.]|uniref:caspase family protein n=1 Tax=Hwanghaeella sp. TaxID=2605943 RepID=UPI003CCC1B06
MSILHRYVWFGLGIVLIWCCVWSGSAGAQTAGAPDRDVFNRNIRKVALVVGAADYADQEPLANPLRDAAAVADKLKGIGFEVIETVNPTIDDLRDAEDDFLDAALDADIALFYFAGHSIQVSDVNYLIPVDARLDDPKSLRRELLDVSRLVSRLDRLAKTKIIILDACRNNPFLDRVAVVSDGQQIEGTQTAQSQPASRGLAPLSTFSEEVDVKRAEDGEAYGTVIAYAAAAGRTASDGDGEHSPYTTALLERLDEPGLEVGRMFRAVAGDVLKNTNGVQRPEYLVRLTNEVYFRFPEPLDCDYLAAEPYNNLGIPGVEFDSIRTAEAIPACRDAVTADPDNPRFLHNLARALDAARRFDEAVPLYRQAAEKGFVFAENNLGVMLLNGQGTKQDFQAGTEWLLKASKQGYRQARVNLTGIDFLSIYDDSDFLALARHLTKAGFTPGEVIDRETVTRALAGYQRANKLVVAGATLETLHHLGALATIPAYSIDD